MSERLGDSIVGQTVSPEKVGFNYLFYSDFYFAASAAGLFHNLEEKNHPAYIQIGSGTDTIQEYRLNSVGYRSPEFSDKTEILFVGDSNTYGVGIPYEYLWHTMLAKELGINNYASLGVPGASIQSNVNDIFHYIRAYNIPSKIVVAFPDIYRALIFQNKKLFRRKDVAWSLPQNITLGNPLERMNNINNFSKRPHDPSDILNNEHLIMNAIQWVNILEDYCESLGVDLYWTSFDSRTAKFFEILKSRENQKKYYKYFVGSDASCLELTDAEFKDKNLKGIIRKKLSNGTYEELTCHSEEEEALGELFHAGTDDPPHLGVHKHIHMKEMFLESMSGGAK